MGSAKIISYIGATVGILSVLLSLFLPEIISWYRLDAETMAGPIGYFLHGLGIFVASNPAAPIPPWAEELVLLGLIGGILTLVGAAACIIGAYRELRKIAIIGGLLMIISPFLIALDMIIGLSDYSALAETLTHEKGLALFFGSKSPLPGMSITWGLWIGSFLAMGGGLVGLIGGTSLH